MKRPLSSYNVVLYKMIVAVRCVMRKTKWLLGKQKFAKELSSETLPYRVYKHQSVLVRKLGDADLQLQYNKVTNIELAIKNLNGIVIKSGETFSFFYLVRKTSKGKGYLDGMMLSDGEAIKGIGGGICQIANLIHWICLHSPLTVTERHHHSFDPFPDSGRVVPFGCGASLFYNYVDYQFRNDTEQSFQLFFWLDKKCLNGDLRIDKELPFKFHIEEQQHEFLCYKDRYYRKNELHRNKIKKIGGNLLESKCLQRNLALVKYTPETFRDIDENEWLALERWRNNL